MEEGEWMSLLLRSTIECYRHPASSFRKVCTRIAYPTLLVFNSAVCCWCVTFHHLVTSQGSQGTTHSRQDWNRPSSSRPLDLLHRRIIRTGHWRGQHHKFYHLVAQFSLSNVFNLISLNFTQILRVFFVFFARFTFRSTRCVCLKGIL